MDNLSPDTAAALLQASQNSATEKLRSLQSSVNTKGGASLDEVAQDFEAMFMAEMLKPMFEGVKPNSMFGGGKTEEVFKGLLIQEYGKLAAQTGQIGIADAIKNEMIKMQEIADGQ